MVATRVRAPDLRVDLRVGLPLSAATVAIALLAAHKLGAAGLFAPLALALVAAFLLRPVVAVTLVVALTVLCEGSTFGIFTFASHLYAQVYKDVSLLDVLVILAVLAVFLDLIRDRRPLYVPGPLRLPLLLLLLAMVAGALEGRANGSSIRFVVASENVLLYLLLLPLAVVNLKLDGRQLKLLLAGAVALAIVKAGLGLAEVASGHGQLVEGSTPITYYEPTANWLIMMVLLGISAMLLARAKSPRWTLFGVPLLLACLLLSYRRSFWIAAALGFLLVLLLGTSPMGRRLLLPVGLLVVLAIWLLGSIHFQSQSPIVKRFVSLETSKLDANVEDRYRLDERANVIAEIERQPITGIGMTIPWKATARPLPIEHEGGRLYVHFAALWFWLKLGMLGLCSYIAMIVASAVISFRAWRRSSEPIFRAFGLASLCGVAGLVVLDTTASFTGVDARFTVLLAAQLGLLALIADRRWERPTPAV